MAKTEKMTIFVSGIQVTLTVPSIEVSREADAVAYAILHAQREIAEARAAGYTPVSATATESGAWVTCQDALAIN